MVHMDMTLNNNDDAVCTRFASGCCSIVTFAVRENEKGGRSCFIGLLQKRTIFFAISSRITFLFG